MTQLEPLRLETETDVEVLAQQQLASERRKVSTNKAD
jgi:hypothetical protein